MLYSRLQWLTVAATAQVTNPGNIFPRSCQRTNPSSLELMVLPHGLLICLLLNLSTLKTFPAEVPAVSHCDFV